MYTTVWKDLYTKFVCPDPDHTNVIVFLLLGGRPNFTGRTSRSPQQKATKSKWHHDIDMRWGYCTLNQNILFVRLFYLTSIILINWKEDIIGTDPNLSFIRAIYETNGASEAKYCPVLITKKMKSQIYFILYRWSASAPLWHILSPISEWRRPGVS